MTVTGLKRLRKQSVFCYAGLLPHKKSKIAGTNNEF